METTDRAETGHLQRMAALDNANRIRFKRARLKKEIGAGQRNPARVIQKPPDFAENMRIHELLMSVPGLGRSKVDRLLIRCRIAPNKALGSLTDRQRVDMARGIKEKAWLT